MKKTYFAILVSAFVCLLAVTVAVAQTDHLSLKISRDWGYGGFNGDIQGLFTMHVTGSADLARVTFYIDDTAIGEVNDVVDPQNWTLPLGVELMFRNEVHYVRKTEFHRRIQSQGCS